MIRQHADAISPAEALNAWLGAALDPRSVNALRENHAGMAGPNAGASQHTVVRYGYLTEAGQP